MVTDQFGDMGAEIGKVEEPTVSPNGHEDEEDGQVPRSFNDMDSSKEPRGNTSDAEAKLKVADYIVRPKGKFNLRQMSRVSPQDEKVLILLELQTEAHRLLTGSAKDEDGEPLLAGDMALDILARYSRARDGGLIVDALKVIQIEGEKEGEDKGSRWG